MQRIAFDERTYIAYNDAIFEYFFNRDRAGQLTTLAFDDYAATQIASELAVPGAQLTTVLCAMVGGLINPAKQDPYVFWERRDPRLSTALLACAVLMMSRLGSNASGQVNLRGFHKRYNLEVMGLETTDNVPGIQRQDQLWKRFAAYLAESEDGQLGRLTFVPLLNYVHLNYPASQCLVRVMDRKRLQGLFQEFCDPAIEIDKDLVAHLLKDRAAGLTLMLQRAVSHLLAQDELSKQMWQIVEAEYEVWRAAPEQVARKILQRRQTGRREGQQSVSAGMDASSPVVLSDVCSSDLAGGAEDLAGPIRPRIRSAHPRPTLRAVESRLALVEAYRSPARLYVEVRSSPENDLSSCGRASTEGWIRLPEEIGASEFCGGLERILGSSRFREYGRSICAFARTEYGWIETEKLTVGEPLRIVYDHESFLDAQALADASLEHRPINMADPLLQCVSLTLRPELERADIPAAVLDILSEAITTVKLTSGLRLRSGRYLAVGPPDIIFIHPTEESLDVYLDGKPIGNAIREAAFKIRIDGLSFDRHVVRVGDRARSFVIASEDDEESEAQNASVELDSDLGTIVARHPPRMETSDHAEAMKIKELGQLNAVVVVGAELLLPYSRAIQGS